MKYFCAFLIFVLYQPPVVADDKYTNDIYTAVTLLYWCIYREAPKNENDISRVTNIDEPNENITIHFNDWISELSYTVNGDVMKIKNGNTTSTSNCNSVEIVEN